MLEQVMFQGQWVSRLCSGDAEVLIDPDQGGRILVWRKGKWEILHWPKDADWDHLSHVRGGNPILFPFLGRTFLHGQKGLWVDAQGVVRPAPMHGFARDCSFRVVDGGKDYLHLALSANDTTLACYPFSFRFDLEYRLTGEALETVFRVTNQGGESMPWSGGHHFYFKVPAGERKEWKLTLPCQEWGRQEFTTGKISTEPAGNPSAFAANPGWVDRLHLQPDPRGVELEHLPSKRRLAFELSPTESGVWSCVTTWTEKEDSDFFCVEPWTALPNAIHHGRGLRKIAPGQSEKAVCRIVATHPN